MMNKYRVIIDGTDFDKIKIFCGDNYIVVPGGITTNAQITEWVANMVKAQNGPAYELSFADNINRGEKL